MHKGLRARFLGMKMNGPLRMPVLGMAALMLTLALGACAQPGDLSGGGPDAGPGAVDTRSTALPGSTMPAIGGASNGGGVSGGGAGTGSIGGGR